MNQHQHQQQQQQQAGDAQGWRLSMQDYSPGQERARLLGSTASPSSTDGFWQQQGHQQHYHSRPISSGGAVSRSRCSWGQAARVVWEVLRQLGSPPMVGCMVAVVVGLIRPLRDQLFAPEGKLLMLQVRIVGFSARQLGQYESM